MHRQKPYNSTITYIKSAANDALRSEEKCNIYICIDGIKFNVKWYEDEKMRKGGRIPIPMTLQLPPIQSSPSNILNALNDDCLREIFNSEVLDIWDLCSLADVCQRFREIAKEVFPHKYNNRWIDWACLWRTERLLQIFDSSFTTLNNFHYQLEDILCGLIAEHCTKITKLTCKLREPASLIHMRPLMQRLSALEITFDDIGYLNDDDGEDGNSGIQLNDLFDSQPIISIETLKIKADRSRYTLHLPSATLVNLRSFHLQFVSLDEMSNNKAFFSRNPQLEKLEFRSCYVFSIDDLLKHLSNIHDLTLGCSLRVLPSALNYSHFEQMQSLKVLRFPYYWDFHMSIHKALEAIQRGRVELERLTLPKSNERIDTAIHRISSIKYLEIEEIRDEDELVRMASMFSNIDEIVIQAHRITFNGIRNALLHTSPSVKWTISVNRYRANGVYTIDARDIAAIEDMVRRRGIRARIDIRLCAESRLLFR